MRFHFETIWLRMVVELFPRAAPFRRYRLARAADAAQARRRMVRRISRQLRTVSDSS